MHYGLIAPLLRLAFNPPPFGWHSDWNQSCQSSSRYRVYESKSRNGCLSLDPNNIDSNKSSNSGNTGSQVWLISNIGNVNEKSSSIVIAKARRNHLPSGNRYWSSKHGSVQCQENSISDGQAPSGSSMDSTARSNWAH